ncbi:MAG: protein kinase, partial [Verrucomicrobiota bacterium]|nr:protein kinase [Verrucomicrobiota bacterium]
MRNAAERFEQESRALVALNHPNIVTVYEIGEDGATHYIASELIEGETLRQRLARGSMPVEEALDVAIQVASAIAAAHAAGIVHRDIKPENIMLRPDGYVKVLDFGIATLAEQEARAEMPQDDRAMLVEPRVSSIVGTARYMSPEQARGESVGKATDIWSMGVVLYEMVAGEAPFRGQNAREVMASTLENEPPLPTGCTSELQQIIAKAICKMPEERHESARALIEELRDLRRRMDAAIDLSEFPRTAPREPWIRATVALGLAVLLATLALIVYWQHEVSRPPPPQKSIAVLPFQNLSKDPENAVFAEGVQDEILSSLAKVGDLKVISRSSVMSYRGSSQRNLPEIGRQLGVAHLLEGSVQRSGNRLRIHAQLIDARTDSHLWAQTYDRDLSDLFAIQSEIARTIAEQLQATLSTREKAAIAQPPTKDLVANELYLKAIALEADAGGSPLEAIKLLERAVGRDPQFVRAHCALARLHLFLYEREDHTPGRLRAAEASIEKAAQNQPAAGEVHLIRARYLSRALRDYDRARAELELARRSLPNDPWVYHEAALMDRRQGRLAEAQQNYAHAIELDPRNKQILANAAVTCAGVRQYAEAIRLTQRILALNPTEDWARIFIASQVLHERAQPALLRAELETAIARDRGAASNHAADLFECAIYQRDAAEAERALELIPPA